METSLKIESVNKIKYTHKDFTINNFHNQYIMIISWIMKELLQYDHDTLITRQNTTMRIYVEAFPVMFQFKEKSCFGLATILDENPRVMFDKHFQFLFAYASWFNDDIRRKWLAIDVNRKFLVASQGNDVNML